MRREAVIVLLTIGTIALTACGGGSSTSQENLTVSPQNTTLLKGVNRISIALLDLQQNPVQAHNVTLQIVNAAGSVTATRPMTNIGSQYNGIPVLVGVADFPDIGQYEYVVHGLGPDGGALNGHAYVTVQPTGPEVAVGARVPDVNQKIIGDAGVTISMVDSGVPPDDWHTATVAQGVAMHRPLVLYFGDPAYCPTKTCGPTRQILQQLCAQFCSLMLFEHIETYYPAGPPGPTAHVNPAFDAFGLQTDPWVYMVNADGIVSDRFEGPVTLDELQQSAQGTLAGRVPAVSLS
ncbi:MAG: hypothetical protein JOY80_02850 [Candidatus Dormibacteraeota bacterium]|nr:hypothetical protein [Candidatus Dormibacteraeota bacterium]